MKALWCWHKWVWRPKITTTENGYPYQWGYCAKCNKAKLRWIE